MPSNNEPLAKAELEASEAKRNLAAELLQSVREMKAGQVSVVTSPVIEARKKPGCRSKIVCSESEAHA